MSVSVKEGRRERDWNERQFGGSIDSAQFSVNVFAIVWVGAYVCMCDSDIAAGLQARMQLRAVARGAGYGSEVYGE